MRLDERPGFCADAGQERLFAQRLPMNPCAMTQAGDTPGAMFWLVLEKLKHLRLVSLTGDTVCTIGQDRGVRRPRFSTLAKDARSDI